MRRGIILACALIGALWVAALLCLGAGGLWITRRPSVAVLPSPSPVATTAIPPASPTLPPPPSTPAASPVVEPTAPPPEPTVPPPAEPTATARLVASPTPPFKPTATQPPIVETPAPPDAVDTLAVLQAAEVAPRDLFELAKGFGRIPADAERVPEGEAPTYTIGAREMFSVSNTSTSSYYTTTAVLRLQTEHAQWWIEEGLDVPQADLEMAARTFENTTYPTNREFFGSEWSPGIDRDPRLHIFIGEIPGVGGYFYSPDEYPRTINPYSNQREMFYINYSAARPGESFFDGTLAHEFQHMIHWNQDTNEDLWANEGLAELAIRLNGFNLGSVPEAYAREPDHQLTQWDDQTTANYGAAYLFMEYFLQRFGDEALRALIASPENGPAAFDEVLAGFDLTFDELFADWLVANALDDAELEGGKFSYSDLEAHTPESSDTHQAYPVTTGGSVHQYGADFIQAEAPRGQLAGTLTLSFEGSTQVAVLPTEPPEGDYFVWSNRGDSSETRLTREFDLGEVSSATLDFATWYDLETGWDYAYVSVSTDGGTYWQIVPTTSATEHNPTGNAFGPGFTGRSGVGLVELGDERQAQWVREQVDLSAYAGRRIMIRFQMITDDAINRPGLVVDDIRIPELDYHEGFEDGLGGWEPVGAVRVDNLLPQRYLVQVITRGQTETSVHRLELDASNRGELRVPDFGGDVRSALIVVSGITPVTTELAPYSYNLEME